MNDIHSLDKVFYPSPEDQALIYAARDFMLDPSPSKLGRLDQWGLGSEYDIYAEIAAYRELEITMRDGTSIGAALSTPRNLAAGQTCPVIIMPAPLSPLGWASYIGMFRHWAMGGYMCLAYSQRGLVGPIVKKNDEYIPVGPQSTGKIQVAGPLDWSDGTEIINYLVGLEGAAPGRIGCFGASYGAGTSFLLAAHDQRVKAVSGASAWTDLFLSLYENNTRHIWALEALVALFSAGRELEESCSEEFRDIINKVRGNHDLDDVEAFARVRSPSTYLNTYNANRLPMLMTTSWHETIFSVPGVVDFYRSLQAPKSLLIQIGDHGNSELPGLLGLPAKPTSMTYRWMDHYLGGHSGDGRPPGFGVRSESMHNLLSEIRHDTWESYSLPAKEFCLGDAVAGKPDGRMIPEAPQPGWTRSLRAGTDTEAIVAPALVQTGVQERLGLPHLYNTAGIDREHAWVWNSAPLEQAMRVQGELRMRITVKAEAETATIVAYLFDYNPLTRRAFIITNAPYTFLNKEPGETKTVTFNLQPAHYVLMSGHQLQLIIDTEDKFFAVATVNDTTLEASSPTGSHSYISIPLHELPKDE